MAAGLAQLGHQRMGQVQRRAAQAGLAYLQRPQRQRPAGAEIADGLLFLHLVGAQHAARGQGESIDQVAFLGTGLELDHHHGWRGRQVMGADHFQHALGQARELRVHLQLDACAQKAEALQQALHIGVGHIGVVQRKTARDLGKGGSELGAQLAQIGQFAVVVLDEAGIHGVCGGVRAQALRFCSETWPVSRSRLVLSSSSSG